MKEIVKQINCPHLKLENGGADSVTMWFSCKVTNKITDVDSCGNCKNVMESLLEGIETDERIRQYENNIC